MSYRWSPSTEKPELTLVGNQIALDDNVSNDYGCPAVINEFLNNMLWATMSSHPDTNEPFWQKKDMGMRLINGEQQETDLTEGMLFFWYEAVAYEHAKMMSIGLGE